MTQSVIQIKEKDELDEMIVRQAFAQTVELDLIDVKPMKSPVGIPKEKLDSIIKRIEAENRQSMIENIESDDYVKLIIKEIKDDEEYKELLEKYGSHRGELFYLDYKYSDDIDTPQ